VKTYRAEPVFEASNALGEGPVWDGENRQVVWVDIDGKELWRYRPETGMADRTAFDKKIGAAVPARDGSWVLAMQDGFYRLNPATGETALIAATDEPNPANRLNDGKVDRSGRFWAGTISAKWEKDGSLYLLEEGGRLTRKLTGIVCSNGLAWNEDDSVMYYIDTGDGAVFAFDYRAGDGTIANRRVLIDFAGEEGNPDGMTIDAEGMLWIAHWGGWQVTRWDPRTGRKLASVSVPAKNVTSCTFGGENLDELYITSARNGNDESELAEQPLAGALFRIKTDTRGLPVHMAAI
jgi:sugar lactone lactonase YvrE